MGRWIEPKFPTCRACASARLSYGPGPSALYNTDNKFIKSSSASGRKQFLAAVFGAPKNLKCLSESWAEDCGPVQEGQAVFLAFIMT